MHDSTDERPIAVLGLGPMGAAIAGALQAAGERVRVWNRTPKALTEIGLTGAIEQVNTPDQAARNARLVVICVRDHTASREIVRRIAGAVGDAVVVNVSTGTPADTTESARRAAAAGVRYVTGAVMVPTSMVGTEHCEVLYAGSEDDIDAIDALMRAMGGRSDVLGAAHALPPALDLAMLDVYFAGMYAFMHAAALAQAHGVDVQRFLPYASSVVDTLRGSLPELADALGRRTYDGGAARLDMCLAFLDKIVASSAEVGLDPGLVGVVRDASARALERWPPATDWDVVAEDFRPARGAAA